MQPICYVRQTYHQRYTHTVELLMRKLADGFIIADVLAMYPHLTIEQVQAEFSYAADKIADEITYEIAA